MDACEPPGRNLSATRQYPQRYAFVRRAAPVPATRWDSDGALYGCVALSRLLVPNRADGRFAARLEGNGLGQVIQPAGGFRCWTVRPTRRCWLSRDEAHQLRLLHERWRDGTSEWPERVRHALWMFEYGFRIQFVEVAIPHYVTTLEALLNTDEIGSGRQFRERLPRLSERVGGPDIDEARCRDIWRSRSKAVHGRVPIDEGGAESEALENLQEIARLALLEALSDADMCATFRDASTVRAAFPVG